MYVYNIYIYIYIHVYTHGGDGADGGADEPVVAVDDVEVHGAVNLAEVAHEGLAHVLDLAHKVPIGLEVDLVVDDAPDLVLPGRAVRGAREDVHLVALGVQGAGQLLMGVYI